MIAVASIGEASGDAPKTASFRGSLPPMAVVTRPPHPEDAAALQRLVRETRTLESNSTYAYLLLCTHFAETSVLAESDGRLVGCALGYRLPERPDTLFIWQIGVDVTFQRRGVALRLLDDLMCRPSLSDAEQFETTIAPSNEASRALFERWARAHGMSCTHVDTLERTLFGPESNHEEENLYRIGPRTKTQ